MQKTLAVLLEKIGLKRRAKPVADIRGPKNARPDMYGPVRPGSGKRPTMPEECPGPECSLPLFGTRARGSPDADRDPDRRR
jgi:hypothetical protein